MFFCLRALLALTLIAAGALLQHASAQCTVQANFSLPDSVCRNVQLALQNTSTGTALQYDWDFCANPLTGTPSGTRIFSDTLSQMTANITFLQFVYDSVLNRYYAFAQADGRTVLRFNFGNSLTNTPTLTSYTVSLLTPNPRGKMSFFKVGAQWYAFCGNNSSGFRVLRFSFGTDLETTTPSVVSVAGLNSMNMPNTTLDCSLVEEGTNYVLFVTSVAGNFIYRVNFGTNPLGSALSVDQLNTNPYRFQAITVVKECDKTHIFGIGIQATTSYLLRLSFDSSVYTIPVLTALSTYTLFPPAMSISAFDAGSEKYIFPSFGTTLRQVRLSEWDQNPFQDVSTTLTLGAQGYTLLKLPNGSKMGFAAGTTAPRSLNYYVYASACGASIATSTDSLPHVTYTTSGKKFINLKVYKSNGQYDHYSDTLIVLNSPTASFSSPGTACSGKLASFVSTSTIPSPDSIASLVWDLGLGGAPSSGTTASAVYPDSGNYTVKLTATSSLGCTDSVSQSFYVHLSPTAGFSLDAPCARQPALLADTTASPDSISLRAWILGDGTFAFNQDSVLHTYPGGAWEPQLIVETEFGCRDTATQNLIFPSLSIGHDNACADAPVAFSASYTYPGDVPTGFTWNYDDGSPTGSGALPAPHLFPAPGTYDVQLIVNTQNGCADTLTRPVALVNSPTFTLDVGPGLCQNQALNFSYNPDYTPEPLLPLRWTFGDPGSGQDTAVGTSVQHTYFNTGLFAPSLQVRTLSGCVLDSIFSIDIAAPPSVVALPPDTACAGQEVVLTRLALPDPLDPIVATTWSLQTPNGTLLSQLDQPELTLPEGTWPGQVRLASLNNCVATDSFTLVVSPMPDPSFSVLPASGQAPLPVQFSQTQPAAPGETLRWTFGTGDEADTANPTYVYADGGTYTVVLVRTTLEGCTASTERSVSVSPALVPVWDINLLDLSLERANDRLQVRYTLFNQGNQPVDSVRVLLELPERPAELLLPANLQPGGFFSGVLPINWQLAASEPTPGFACMEVWIRPDSLMDVTPENNRLCTSTGSELSIIRLYPNPSTGNVWLDMTNPLVQNVDVKVMDLLGKPVLDQSLSLPQGHNRLLLDAGSLSNGLYVLRLEARGERRESRLVIQR